MTSNKKVLIMGGSGFIGQELGEQLVAQNWQVIVLTRNPQQHQYTLSFPCTLHSWDGSSIPIKAIKNVHAVVNLVGAPIFDHKWSKDYKSKIFYSRLNSVKALQLAFKALTPSERPQVVIQASAVGYYQGLNTKSSISESMPCGKGFLADVCRLWEQESQKLANYCRVSIVRIGLVLGWTGGAFPKIMNIYACKLGSILGSGKQWMNWIHIDDLTNLIITIVNDDNYSGTYNAVSSQNTSNQQFHNTLCQYTASFKHMLAPSLALKAIMGARSQLILNNMHIVPQKLLQQGFKFKSFEAASTKLFSERSNTKDHYLKLKQWLPVSKETLWKFVSSAQNLEKITPKWLKFELLSSSSNPIGLGTTLDYALKLHSIPIKWRSSITAWEPEQYFSDTQLKGPYKRWHHEHFFSDFANGTLIEDRVEFSLAFSPFSLLFFPLIHADVTKIFSYRKKELANIFSKKTTI